MSKTTAKIGSMIGRAAVAQLGPLFRRYILDEALVPLRHLGRRLAFGVIGAVCIAVGSVVALVGMLRALETETGTTFGGHWSFAPYLITAAAAAIALVGFLAFGFKAVIARPKGRARRRSRRG